MNPAIPLRINMSTTATGTHQIGKAAWVAKPWSKRGLTRAGRAASVPANTNIASAATRKARQ